MLSEASDEEKMHATELFQDVNGDGEVQHEQLTSLMSETRDEEKESEFFQDVKGVGEEQQAELSSLQEALDASACAGKADAQVRPLAGDPADAQFRPLADDPSDAQVRPLADGPADAEVRPLAVDPVEIGGEFATEPFEQEVKDETKVRSLADDPSDAQVEFSALEAGFAVALVGATRQQRRQLQAQMRECRVMRARLAAVAPHLPLLR